MCCAIDSVCSDLGVRRLRPGVTASSDLVSKLLPLQLRSGRYCLFRPPPSLQDEEVTASSTLSLQASVLSAGKDRSPPPGVAPFGWEPPWTDLPNRPAPVEEPLACEYQ